MASARYWATLDGALTRLDRQVDRYTRNGKDAPAEIWRTRDTIRAAVQMANSGKSDREVREYLEAQGVTTA